MFEGLRKQFNSTKDVAILRQVSRLVEAQPQLASKREKLIKTTMQRLLGLSIKFRYPQIYATKGFNVERFAAKINFFFEKLNISLVFIDANEADKLLDEFEKLFQEILTIYELEASTDFFSRW